MSHALAIFATLLGGTVGLLMLVLLLAGSPNSSPQQLMFIKLSMLATAVVCLVCAGAAIWLMIAKHPWWGLAAGFSPVVFCIALITTWHFLEQARLTREAKDHPWSASPKQASDK